MAIELEARIHPSPAVPPVPAAYLAVERIDYNRMVKAMVLHLVVFACKEDRDKVKGAVSDLAKHTQEHMDAQAAKDDEALIMAQHKLHLAQVKIRGVQTLQPVNVPLMVTVPPKEIGECLTDGEPDVAKCYGWLVKQPAYQGVEV